jgi:hypothetical protein
MLLVFILLLPLVLVPVLIEWDSKWFRRFAMIIAGVQLIVMLFRYAPDNQTSMVSIGMHLPESIHALIRSAAVHLFLN